MIDWTGCHWWSAYFHVLNVNWRPIRLPWKENMNGKIARMKPIVTMTGLELWSKYGAKYLADNGNNNFAVDPSTDFRAMKRLQRFPIKANASAIKTSNMRLSTLASHPRATAKTIRIDLVNGLTCFKKSFDTPPRPIVFIAFRACLPCFRLLTLYNPIAVQCSVDKQYSYPPDNRTNNRDVFHQWRNWFNSKM